MSYTVQLLHSNFTHTEIPFIVRNIETLSIHQHVMCQMLHILNLRENVSKNYV